MVRRCSIALRWAKAGQSVSKRKCIRLAESVCLQCWEGRKVRTPAHPHTRFPPHIPHTPPHRCRAILPTVSESNLSPSIHHHHYQRSSKACNHQHIRGRGRLQDRTRVQRGTTFSRPLMRGTSRVSTATSTLWWQVRRLEAQLFLILLSLPLAALCGADLSTAALCSSITSSSPSALAVATTLSFYLKRKEEARKKSFENTVFYI